MWMMLPTFSFAIQDVSKQKSDWTTDRWLAIVFGIFGVICFVYALIQYRDSKEIRIDLKKVEGQTSTKGVATFPHNLPQIISTIASANRELLILCDFAGYAMYSDPALCDQYIATIRERASVGVSVRILLYSFDLAHRAVMNQFPPGPPFGDTKLEDRYKLFFERNNVQEVPTDHQSFCRSVFEIESEKARALGKVTIRVSTEKPHFFCWLANDPQKIVFSHRNDVGAKSGLSVYTEDANLANEYRSMFETLWATSSPPLGFRF